MGFYSLLQEHKNIDIDNYIQKVSEDMIINSIKKDDLDHLDFLNLLSPLASKHLEAMARKANKLSVQNFGRVISLYAPLYVANYCTNHCTYCGFSIKNNISRKQLSLQEVEKEAIEIASTGIKHILLLTGEDKKISNISYLEDVVRVLKNHFSSITLEVFPMDIEEYSRLKAAGVDSLTIYQEVYNEEIYSKVHLKGKKSDYHYRLDTAERGAKAGLRAINIGTLFGLGELISEAYYSGLHGRYLMNKYMETELSLSLPRINPAEGGFVPNTVLSDKQFVQFILAYRLFLPKVGLNLSTREKAHLRDNLIPLGITKFSAGSKTSVGGYDEDKNLATTAQFDTSDKRSVEEIVNMIESKGYQVIFKDWEAIW